MKVAAVFYEIEAEGGGVHTFAGELLAAIREADSRHEFVYYAASGKAAAGAIQIPTDQEAFDQRWEILRAREQQDRIKAPRDPEQRTWFERSLDQNDVDFVWFATAYAEDCDRPYVMTVMDIEHARMPWFPEVSRDGLWEQRDHYYRQFTRKATAIIAANEAAAEQVMRNYGVDRDRFLLLHHPTPRFALDAADTDAARTAIEENGITEPYLFYPAQFWAHKNHTTLLDALGELNKGDEGFDLVCVGSDKGQQANVRALAEELGLADRVHLLGFVGTDELVALYQNAYALAYVSLFGPENLPPLEAMALGCPVVVSDIPGAREQCGEAALYAPPQDAQGLVDAVRELADDGVRDRLVEAGRERAGSFVAADYVDGVIDFLDRFERINRGWSRS